MQDFRNLRVWQHAKDLSVLVHRLTQRFPIEERFGLSSQIRRSAQSICANIAEGCGYRGAADSARFFQMALGSNCECLSHLIVVRELDYMDDDTYRTLDERLLAIRKMLLRLIKRIRSST